MHNSPAEISILRSTERTHDIFNRRVRCVTTCGYVGWRCSSRMWYAERVSLLFPISTIAVVKNERRFILMMTTSVSLFDNHRHEGAALLLSARLLFPVSFSTGGVSGCRPCTGIRMAPAMAGNPLPKITPAAREDKSSPQQHLSQHMTGRLSATIMYTCAQKCSLE